MKKVLLCILDGLGFDISKFGNPTFEAKFLYDLLKHNPHTMLKTYGRSVGLPESQVGGSEVGHIAIGTGRIVKQYITVIDEDIASLEIEKSKDLLIFLNQLRFKNGCVHILGMFSNGGIHSHTSHYLWAIKFFKKNGVQVRLHIFLDGRDTIAKDALITLSKAISNGDIDVCDIATVQGRRIAMDRDNNLDRTELSISAILSADSTIKSNDPLKTISQFYEKDITDEDIPPFVMESYNGADDNDSFFIINFRTDRIIQTVEALLKHGKDILCMPSFNQKIDSQIGIIFKQNDIKNSLGEVISNNKIHQLRIAETEKYPHVTKFFNGGRTDPFDLEDRIFVKSNDIGGLGAPKMSSSKITEDLILAIKSDRYGFICVNYADTDVIGHTGNFDYAVLAMIEIDKCLRRLHEQCISSNYTLIITADHGNIERMINDDNTPNKCHTFSPVPFIIVSNDNHELKLTQHIRSLVDVAPTILEIMGIEKPIEMTGESLLV